MLHIKSTDRVLAVGQTGSGKTTLLRTLFERLPYRGVLDTKQDPDDKWAGKRFTKQLQVEREWNKGPFVYAPDAAHQTPDAFEDFFQFWYEVTQNVPLLIDEAQTRGILNSVVYSHYCDLLLRQGRGRKQPLWMGSQRPKWLKNEAISEAEHKFIGHLEIMDDRRKIADICDDRRLLEKHVYGPDEIVLPHAFYYLHNGVVRYMYPIGYKGA